MAGVTTETQTGTTPLAKDENKHVVETNSPKARPLREVQNSELGKLYRLTKEKEKREEKGKVLKETRDSLRLLAQSVSRDEVEEEMVTRITPETIRALYQYLSNKVSEKDAPKAIDRWLKTSFKQMFGLSLSDEDITALRDDLPIIDNVTKGGKFLAYGGPDAHAVVFDDLRITRWDKGPTTGERPEILFDYILQVQVDDPALQQVVADTKLELGSTTRVGHRFVVRLATQEQPQAQARIQTVDATDPRLQGGDQRGDGVIITPTKKGDPFLILINRDLCKDDCQPRLRAVIDHELQHLAGATHGADETEMHTQSWESLRTVDRRSKQAVRDPLARPEKEYFLDEIKGAFAGFVDLSADSVRDSLNKESGKYATLLQNVLRQQGFSATDEIVAVLFTGVREYMAEQLPHQAAEKKLKADSFLNNTPEAKEITSALQEAMKQRVMMITAIKTTLEQFSDISLAYKQNGLYNLAKLCTLSSTLQSLLSNSQQVTDFLKGNSEYAQKTVDKITGELQEKLQAKQQAKQQVADVLTIMPAVAPRPQPAPPPPAAEGAPPADESPGDAGTIQFQTLNTKIQDYFNVVLTGLGNSELQKAATPNDLKKSARSAIAEKIKAGLSEEMRGRADIDYYVEAFVVYLETNQKIVYPDKAETGQDAFSFTVKEGKVEVHYENFQKSQEQKKTAAIGEEKEEEGMLDKAKGYFEGLITTLSKTGGWVGAIVAGFLGAFRFIIDGEYWQNYIQGVLGDQDAKQKARDIQQEYGDAAALHTAGEKYLTAAVKKNPILKPLQNIFPSSFSREFNSSFKDNPEFLVEKVTPSPTKEDPNATTKKTEFSPDKAMAVLLGDPHCAEYWQAVQDSQRIGTEGYKKRGLTPPLSASNFEQYARVALDYRQARIGNAVTSIDDFFKVSETVYPHKESMAGFEKAKVSMNGLGTPSEEWFKTQTIVVLENGKTWEKAWGAFFALEKIKVYLAVALLDANKGSFDPNIPANAAILLEEANSLENVSLAAGKYERKREKGKSPEQKKKESITAAWATIQGADETLKKVSLADDVIAKVEIPKSGENPDYTKAGEALKTLLENGLNGVEGVKQWSRFLAARSETTLKAAHLTMLQALKDNFSPTDASKVDYSLIYTSYNVQNGATSNNQFPKTVDDFVAAIASYPLADAARLKSTLDKNEWPAAEKPKT